MAVDSRDVILCVNAGSSSLKLAMFDGERRVASATVDRIGVDDGRFPDVAAALRAELETADFGSPAAVGHRVVQGGPDHVVPERVTPALLADLRAAVPLAPLHLPATSRPGGDRRPPFRRPQVVCFDTAFHRRRPCRAAGAAGALCDR
jgi:acetate kinase